MNKRCLPGGKFNIIVSIAYLNKKSKTIPPYILMRITKYYHISFITEKKANLALRMQTRQLFYAQSFNLTYSFTLSEISNSINNFLSYYVEGMFSLNHPSSGVFYKKLKKVV